MLKNFIRLAWRNLRKNRTTTIIHITGLSLSVAFCLLLFSYIRHEQSFDGFHTKKDRLFRLEMSDIWQSDTTKKPASFFSFLTKKDDGHYGLVFPAVVAIDMQNQFPEIKTALRFNDWGDQIVKVNGQIYKEPHVIYTDDNFFESFSFKLKKGDPHTVLKSVKNVVLSESIARKYFGNADPIGKTVAFEQDGTRLYTVAGIAEDAPSNSSIRYDWVVPLLSDPGYPERIKQRFNQMSLMMILELNPGVDPIQFQAKMNKWVDSYFTPSMRSWSNTFDFSKYRWNLRPFADAHYNPSPGWGHYTNANNIYQLACLVIVILLIAALNYVLLSISNVAARSQEAGLRKVMGARRWSIIIQFWVETQLLVFASVLLGLALAALFLPFMEKTLDTQIDLNTIPFTEIFVTVGALSLTLGILAGYYPAWLLSKMKAVNTIKSFQTFKVNPRLSKVLVVLQYTCCIVLMMSAFVINRQMSFISHKDLGFDKEQIIIVKNPLYDSAFTVRTRNRLYTFARTQPYITQYAGMNGGLDGNHNTNGFKLNGKQEWLQQFSVDYNYFNMLGLTLVKGRFFSPEFQMDTARRVQASIINQTLYAMLGEPRLGVYDSAIRSTIVGVVKDYHYESLTKKIGPQQHVLPWGWGYTGNFLFKVKAGQMPQAIAGLKKEWKEITGDYPFDYTFLDEKLAEMYKADTHWEATIQASCFFALFIACMGLFGLSAINAINRTKEVGIRKVLGATVRNIVTSLSSQFVGMVILSLLIAIPLSWWLMNKWLEDFAYHIKIQWWMFALIGVLAMLTALVTVSFNAIRAALANPVDSLRAE
ncbi:MAG TPA: FtsX-like permease family protein [Puia sp.]|jgi:putative ABC transport system permease protein